MMRALLGRLLGRSPPAPGRPRVTRGIAPAVTYAVGDVHGRLDLLKQIERTIVEDARDVAGARLLVMLGDYVDRGPHSAQVLDHLMAPPPPGFERVCLSGNHEMMMLDFLDDPRNGEVWLRNGGDLTLMSYGMDPEPFAGRRDPRRLRNLLDAMVPAEHRAFIEALPVCLSMPGYVFVHAGLRPGLPLAAQADEDLMWIRDGFMDGDHDFGATVVHGHTPRAAASVGRGRISLDTGAFATGILSAARIQPAGPVRILSTGRG